MPSSRDGATLSILSINLSIFSIIFSSQALRKHQMHGGKPDQVSHLLIYQSPACFTNSLTILPARRSTLVHAGIIVTVLTTIVMIDG